MTRAGPGPAIYDKALSCQHTGRRTLVRALEVQRVTSNTLKLFDQVNVVNVLLKCKNAREVNLHVFIRNKARPWRCFLGQFLVERLRSVVAAAMGSMLGLCVRASLSKVSLTALLLFQGHVGGAE